MISVEKAKELIVKSVKPLRKETVLVVNALGRVLSDDVRAPVDLPPFDQSAMDGFALRYDDFVQNKKIKIVGEVAAGNFLNGRISFGQAVRIFTGAPVPVGLDTVVMQEKAISDNHFLSINDTLLCKGVNIRKAGSQIKKGRIALPAGSLVNPGAIGYLTAMGITTIKVISKPIITIVVTGSELKKPGKPLTKGEIYESNSFTLQGALQSIGLKARRTVSVRDSEAKTINTLKKAILVSDLVLITGGISVGDYDFVGKSLQKIGVKNIFYKIYQKPGKPLFFGKYEKTVIFGLPGNPAAVLTCFYEYVYTSIKIMMGHRDIFLKKFVLPISMDCQKKIGLSFFLKGKINDNSVMPLEGQESYILSSFAIADCLIYLPADCGMLKAGEVVEVHLLPSL